MVDRDSASYGTNDTHPPVLPVSTAGLAIIFEWVALLPLTIYLASSQLTYQLVGRVSLLGSLGVSFFPPLGVLNHIASLLNDRFDFFDRASSISELRRTIWDANWGSVFTCANGAASEIISKHTLSAGHFTEIPQVQLVTNLTSIQDIASEKIPIVSEHTENRYRNLQTLHILDFSHTPKRDIYNTTSLLQSTAILRVGKVLLLLALLGFCILTVLFGLYGTATCIFIAFAFQVLCQLVQVRRPPGYLYNNEGPTADSCMLAAIHENASTWYLYKGSRAVIDTLLNKPMIESVSSPLGWILPVLLRFLGVLQLLAVTYVAAQKGWDGVALLAVIFASFIFDHLSYNNNRLAHLWLKREGVNIRSHSFRFTTRSAMIGTIQVLKQSPVISWMDGILAPSSRREAWLACLAGNSDSITLVQNLDQSGKDWVLLAVNQTQLAVNIIMDTMYQPSNQGVV
ncbi:hypothetical protein N7471_005444 [Penicillium samsonianum]|uniref:uncharacterized protein n=1 Tax=Penicillium samsonianum TaxID=1882272 RepID=UPI002547636A|nr:uncharacterized protein N7471_005444 [Penicillium samsonianum]KAJ6138958.1 hypothetical protein N7471_005444 [Penicillium samsonianum]